MEWVRYPCASCVFKSRACLSGKHISLFHPMDGRLDSNQHKLLHQSFIFLSVNTNSSLRLQVHRWSNTTKLESIPKSKIAKVVIGHGGVKEKKRFPVNVWRWRYQSRGRIMTIDIEDASCVNMFIQVGSKASFHQMEQISPGLLLWPVRCPQETIPARREQSPPRPLREQHRSDRADSSLD